MSVYCCDGFVYEYAEIRGDVGIKWLHYYDVLLVYSLLLRQNTDQNWLGEERVSWLIAPCHPLSLREAKAGTQAGTWRKGTEAETLKERNTASWLLSTGLLSCPYTSQVHLPMAGTNHSGLGLPTSISS